MTRVAGLRRGWWRRNAIGLVAVAVLVPTTIAVTFQAEWGRYYAERPSQPITVATGDSIDFAGAGWRVLDSRRIPATSEEGAASRLPAGTDLVVVTVAVSPRELDADGKSPYCDLQLDEMRGSEVVRSWKDATFADIDYDRDPDVGSGCSSDETGDYTFETLFVVPSGATDELAVQLESVDELPRYLRFAL
ncbi:hypothetical protein N1027_18405 [Herbiconiux sp. CPCC 205763]|uniref:DUF4352 domain-containing protein n=1 Tax=Herbiconiux aconitum TaxID=2970913 RepID=A0ABT2GX07_9MICO|nr:hypothetical protein [Herbiconiux aconitum]MCS5720107.1 hypothetical protein [Herbiconiux aconitum]